MNNHAGNSTLVGYCLDAASSAVSSKSSAYNLDFGNDFNPGCILQQNFTFHSQLLAGDDAIVETWQGHQNNLYFNIRKGNKIKCKAEFVLDPQLICKSN